MKNFYFLLIALLCSAGLKAQCPITVNGNTVICYGDSTTLAASSSATSYTWNPGGVNSPTITVKPSITTTYTVIGTDGACTDSATVTVTVNPNPNIWAQSSINPICQFQQVTVLSANGAQTYTWTPPNDLSSTTGAQVSATPSVTTVYTVTGTDANGCVASASLVVGVVPSVFVATTYTNASCGTCNGSIAAIANGGTGSYTYTWSPSGANSPVVNGVCAGMYTCTVLDANGCYANNTVLVQNSNISFSVSVIPAACGQANGSVIIDTASIQGGNPPYHYNYTFNGATMLSPTNVISNLGAGIYSVTVDDTVSGCLGMVQVTIVDSNFTVVINPTQPGCSMCDGAISTTMLGGTPPYSYHWSSGATTSGLSNLCAGNYQLQVTDSNGCFTSTTINLQSPNAPVIHVDSITNITCSGLTTGAITVSVTGGTSPYTYAWNTVPVQNTASATNLTQGNYQVVVTDNTGCTSQTSVYVGNSSTIYVYPLYTNPSNCSTPGSAMMSVYGGQGPYTFTWSNGATGPTATNLTPGVYTVTAVDANGCSGVGYAAILSQCVNTIKGRIYNDANQNCIQDVGENGIAGISLLCTPGYNYAYSDANGDYLIHTTNMINTVTAYNYQQNYFTPTCPSTASLSVTFSQTGDTITGKDFGYWANPSWVDLAIHPGFSSAYPGSSKTYWILFTNNSPSTQNVLIRFTYDPTLQLDSVRSPGIHYPGQHKIEWTFNNVPAGKQWNWQTDPYAYFKVPVSVPITATLHSLFEILPISGDANPGDNTVDTYDPVTGSRDPNSKSVSPAGTGPGGDIFVTDSVLKYTVHFQNNGNDTAYRVVVIDTLSPFLDPATIIPGAANYKFKFDLSGQGICTWTFDSIMLPDSLTNEPASNGYFTYTIKQKPNNALGSVIKNTAYIYFDYNPAVVTNITINTITSPVAVPEHLTVNSGSELMIYPNPTNDRFVVRYNVSETGPVQIEIRNIMGELVKTHFAYGHKKGVQTDELNSNGLANGVYLVRLMCGGQQHTQKLIIQK